MQGQPFWTVLAEFPLFVLRVLAYPRGAVRGMDWDRPETLQRLTLYTVVWLALIVIAFSDNRKLAHVDEPRLSTFKGVMMRAHERSWQSEQGWGWLQLHRVYDPLNIDKGEARRLWDTLLTTGFLSYTMLAGLLAIGVLARLRMWRFKLSWEYALGTGLLSYLPLVTCLALSTVPFTLLLLCRHCWVRLGLAVLLKLLGLAYLGYYTLGDLGERPARSSPVFVKSIGWGLVQYVVAVVIFFALIACVIPA